MEYSYDEKEALVGNLDSYLGSGLSGVTNF